MAKQYLLPTSYSEVYEHYYPSMIKMVADAGIRYQDVPDVAMELLTTFISKDGLSLFDITRVTQPGTEGRLFHAMLRGFTTVYVRKYLDYQKRDVRRISVLTPTMITGEHGTTTDQIPRMVDLASAAGLMGEGVIGEFIESQAFSEDLSAVLSRLKATHPRYDWHAFIEAASDRALDNRSLTSAWLGRRLGVSPKTAKRMLTEFQTTYTELVGVAA